MIIVSSTSKIVKNYSAALTRVKQIAAPKKCRAFELYREPLYANRQMYELSGAYENVQPSSAYAVSSEGYGVSCCSR